MGTNTTPTDIPWVPIFVVAMLVFILVWTASLTNTDYQAEQKHIPKDTVYTRAKVVTVVNNDTLYIITLDK
jgi:hypothetical protein